MTHAPAGAASPAVAPPTSADEEAYLVFLQESAAKEAADAEAELKAAGVTAGGGGSGDDAALREAMAVIDATIAAADQYNKKMTEVTAKAVASLKLSQPALVTGAFDCVQTKLECRSQFVTRCRLRIPLYSQAASCATTSWRACSGLPASASRARAASSPTRWASARRVSGGHDGPAPCLPCFWWYLFCVSLHVVCAVQVISFMAWLIEQGVYHPMIVVCPLSVVGNWCAEIKRFAPSLETTR